MGNRVVVTGIGSFSPFGFGLEVIENNVFRGVDAFRDTDRFDTNRFKTKVSAQSSFQGSYLKAGLKCTKDAIEMAKLDTKINDMPIIIGTQGDFNVLNKYWEGLQGEFSEKVPYNQAFEIAKRLNIKGKKLTFTNGCIASTNAIGYASELIKNGLANVVICGGNSLVNEDQFSKFNAGRALSTDGLVRPFSKKRSGLLLGDGGGILILEEYKHARKRHASILAEILGWGIGTDAFHVTQPHPYGRGMSTAINKAIKNAEINGSEIGYINAHGTGTRLNDSSETQAFKNVWKEKAHEIPISSTKSMTGHTLEGAGALETIITILALENGVIPPTANYEGEDKECDLNYVPNRPLRQRVEIALNVNASFGGNNAALIIKGGGNE